MPAIVKQSNLHSCEMSQICKGRLRPEKLNGDTVFCELSRCGDKSVPNANFSPKLHCGCFLGKNFGVKIRGQISGPKFLHVGDNSIIV